MYPAAVLNTSNLINGGAFNVSARTSANAPSRLCCPSFAAAWRRTGGHHPLGGFPSHGGTPKSSISYVFFP